MKKATFLILSLVLCFSLSLNARTQATMVIDDTLIWSNDTITLPPLVKITNNGFLIVHGPMTLELDSTIFWVDGMMQFTGTAQSKVVIKGKTDSLSGIVSRGGIRIFHQGNMGDTIIFRHCRFEHCGSDSSFQLDGKGALDLMGVQAATVENCVFEGNTSLYEGGGISSLYSNLVISNCIFTHNSAESRGGAIAVHSGHYLLIKNNEFIQNSSKLGGSIFTRDNPAIINGNTFRDNIAMDTISPGAYTGQGGAIYLAEGDTMKISNNHVFNNKSLSAIYDNTLASTFYNNLVFNNFGVGVMFAKNYTSSLFVNNTVCNNGMGGVFAPSFLQYIYNSIIWNNAGLPAYQITFLDSLVMPRVYNSCVFGGFTGPGANNILTDPLFLQPTNQIGLMSNVPQYNWNLSPGSPCINTGLSSIPNFTMPAYDLFGSPRIIGAAVDMGAYEYTDPSGEITHDPGARLIIYPSPADHYMFIKTAITGNISYHIMDILGKPVKSNSNPGNGKIDISDLPPGTYILIARGASEVCSRKFIKL